MAPPLQSDFTSIQQRIHEFKAATPANSPSGKQQASRRPTLLDFIGNYRQQRPEGIPFHLQEYLELVDWTGRQIRPDKRGAIAPQLPPILARIGVKPEDFVKRMQPRSLHTGTVLGRIEALQKYAEHFHCRCIPGALFVNESPPVYLA